MTARGVTRREKPTRHVSLRDDLAVAADLIPNGSRVLDLGCGDGQLLAHLQRHHGCTGSGVEIDPASVCRAIEAGVSVIELDIDHQLTEFASDSYDTVVLSKVLQAARRPAEVLDQMARIAPRVILSVPNFGLLAHRWVLIRGRMPMSRQLPHAWYDTPNIHLSTLLDLEDLVTARGFRIVERVLFDGRGRFRSWPDPLANLLSGAATYLLERPGGTP